MFKEGDRVRINCPDDFRVHGCTGVILSVSDTDMWPYEVAVRRHVTEQPFKWVFNLDELEAL